MFYTFQQALSVRLLIWSMASVALGAWLQRSDVPNRRAFAQQSIAWGAIDGALAIAGWIGAQRKAADPQNHHVHIQRQEASKLRRLLWINAALDVLYILVGVWLAIRNDQERRSWRGHGWGIAVQGVFLLLFDSIHALRLDNPGFTIRRVPGREKRS